MLETVRAKIEVIEHKVLEVIKLFKPLVSRGLPLFSEEKDPLLSQKEYREFLVHCRLDKSKFGDMQQSLSGKVVFDKLTSDLELLFDFKAACTEVPETSYPDTMELKAQAYDMTVATLPSPDLWRIIQQYGSTKFKMHP